MAGCEAAWQIARAGHQCVLFEMRPARPTPAHKTDWLAELVCSNSLKSESENTAPWLLKRELRRCDSLLLRAAQQARVPGGHALTVDREIFAQEVTRAIENDLRIEVRREEATWIASDTTAIIATGPLTSAALAEEIGQLTGAARLFFYDSISPIVEADSIDLSIAFRASRYGKSLDGSDDYLNCPMDRPQYERFVDAVLSAESVPAHIPEDDFAGNAAATAASGNLASSNAAPGNAASADAVSGKAVSGNAVSRNAASAGAVSGNAASGNAASGDAVSGNAVLAAFGNAEGGNTRFFEACLPIEELARRGRETLRFGPMKPMGLIDPRTGRRPYAVVQLRQENLRADSYNLVGFQNHMRFAEQSRIFRMIPGLERAEFLRYGQIHRNTYINGPALLTPALQLRSRPRVFFAGQISGVEGYVESIATGLVAGRHAAELAAGAEPRPFPRATAIGSLCAYVSGADARNYQPANITFDLLPALDEATRLRFRHDKQARHAEVCRRALEKLDEYLASVRTPSYA